VSQEALTAVFQAHPAPAVTLDDPLPAAAPKLALVGESPYVQPPPVVVSRKFATVDAFWL
jgi:hypothetical protein